MTSKRIQFGAMGEAMAVRAYKKQGWKILDRNWRCRYGELDIIVSKVIQNKKILVFCEVKTRSSLAYGYPCEAVSYSKQKRIRKLATIWLQQQVEIKEAKHRQSKFKFRSNNTAGYEEIRFAVAEVMDNKVSIFTYC